MNRKLRFRMKPDAIPVLEESDEATDSETEAQFGEFGCVDGDGAHGDAHGSDDEESSTEDEGSDDSWDDFERGLDEETNSMLNQNNDLSPREFVELMNGAGPPAGGKLQSGARIIKAIFIFLVSVVIAIAINAVLKEYGYWVRCPGAKECGACYGPVWGRSWCVKPAYDIGNH